MDASYAWVGGSPAGCAAPGCAWSTGAHAAVHSPYPHPGDQHPGDQPEDVDNMTTPPVSPDREVVGANTEVRCSP